MERALISFLAANINWIILGFLVAGTIGLAFLAWRSVRIPAQLRYTLSVILDEIRDPVISSARTQDNAGILYSLRQYLAATDPVRRGQLQGRILECDRRKPDVGGEGTRRFAHVLGFWGELFPLLGILGTVCAMAARGLLGAEAGVDQLAGVLKLFETAVTSTIYGIVCAVLFIPLYQWIGSRLEAGYRTAEAYRSWIGEMELEVVRYNLRTA